MKKANIGVLAHVDAGKTTLVESLLYVSGAIRKQGRVDKGDAVLDFDQQERQRGITIYSKKVRMNWDDFDVCFIDTPGHMDFSVEMERALRILDYAIVVINATDGIQAHTRTIIELLDEYQIPSFIFVNKMDLAYQTKEDILGELVSFDKRMCDIFNESELDEIIALGNDQLLEHYMETNSFDRLERQEAIQKRYVLPVLFGSALKNEGVDQLMKAMCEYMKEKVYPPEFGALVYKVYSDQKKDFLTTIKITGGELHVKDTVNSGEKIDQIRLYNGNKYELVQKVSAGDICDIVGPQRLIPGMGIGNEEGLNQSRLIPHMQYSVKIEDGSDLIKTLACFRELAREEPTLSVSFDEVHQDISIKVMGDIQLEVYQLLFQERYGISISFDLGQVAYLETIKDEVVGVGHFEPLQHYAEVHILLQPLEKGSGIVIGTPKENHGLSQGDVNQIMKILLEDHVGVLLGKGITDIKLTLLAGRTHEKHTEGGDLREATLRAVRQGLRKAESYIVEPYYEFEIKIQPDSIGKVIYDIENMGGSIALTHQDDSFAILNGQAPCIELQTYQQNIHSMSQGLGRLQLIKIVYDRCHNEDEVLSLNTYRCDQDMLHPCGSIFCEGGAGFYVPYDQVEKYQHLKHVIKTERHTPIRQVKPTYADVDEELDHIFNMTYGKSQAVSLKKKKETPTYHRAVKSQEEFLLVDGYNIIFGWDDLKELARDNLSLARDQLVDMLAEYQAMRQIQLMIVFDAYKVKDNLGSKEKYNNLYIVYTKEAQTADMYIERMTHLYAKDYQMIVASSDGLEQIIALGHGASRMSARELYLDLQFRLKNAKESYERKSPRYRNNDMENNLSRNFDK